jgi:hypothetical protein
MTDDSDGYELDEGLLMYTSKDILKIGRWLVGCKEQRIWHANKTTNSEQLWRLFGSDQHVYATIWEDFQMTDVEKAQVCPADLVHDEMKIMRYFLTAMHHLKRYPTALEREAMFDISDITGGYWVCFYVEKAVKITLPNDNFGDDIFMMTVDGAHY